MNKGIFYHSISIISILLICSLKSWGSETLPQLDGKPVCAYRVVTDTVPGQKPPEVKKEEPKQEQPVKEAVGEVIKEVPKSKKQVKPVAVSATSVPVKPPVIIKPKVVIKKIGVRIP
ncbi:MAG: hypothetical protein QM731_27375 [Chitinophagaceae bacterium]